jgi:serine/threonine-protein kinase
MDIANFSPDGRASLGRRGRVVLSERYVLAAQLRGGPAGKHYRAIDGAPDATHRTVTLTVLPPHVACNSDQIAALSRELARLRALDHPNVARVFEIGRDGDTWYMTSEYLDGEPLRAVLEHLKPERLAVAEADAAVRAVAEALEHAHARGLAHGDVRAGNVLVTMDQRFVLTNFLARRLKKAPARPATVVDDVRGLAALAVELYTGLPPGAALAPGAEPPAGVPAERLFAVRSVLAAPPAQRAPSIEAFLGAAGLAGLEAEPSVAAPRRSAVARSRAAAPAAPARAAIRRSARAAAPRAARRAWRGAMLVAAVVVGGAWLTGYHSPGQGWRASAAELQRLGLDALRALATRLAPSPPAPPGETPAPTRPPEPAAAAAAAVPTPSAPEPEGAAPPAHAPPATLPDPAPAPDAETPAERPPTETPELREPAEPVAAAPRQSGEREATSFSLDVAAIAARENHTAVALEVVRSGDTAGTAAVRWWTTPGSARAYDDYASLGPSTVTFGPGETVRRLLIPLVDDAVREPAETFTVHVSAQRGGTAGRVMATRVTVHDDD